MGFTFDDTDKKNVASPLGVMHALIKKNPRNKERIFPYIGGEELNNSPTQDHHRFVIDFGGLSEAEARSGWPDLLAIVEDKVKPERMKTRGSYKTKWWQFGRRSMAGSQATAGMNRFLVTGCGATPHLVFAFMPPGRVLANSLDLFPLDTYAAFTALQVRAHEVWARFFGSSLEDRLRYTPSDCFETFAFPLNWRAHPTLEVAGREYYHFRAALMVARNEGLTKTYNRFHDSTLTTEDVKRLRELHAAMDRAVLEAYGWDDLAARAAPIFLDETNEDEHTYQGRLFWPSDFRDEVLARLLALNAERHAEEVRLGIAPGIKRKAEDSDEAETEELEPV
jgi:hypothetical protein